MGGLVCGEGVGDSIIVECGRGGEGAENRE